MGNAFYQVVSRYDQLNGTNILDALEKTNCVGAIGGNIPVNEKGEFLKAELGNLRHKYVGIRLDEVKEIAESRERFGIIACFGLDRCKCIQIALKKTGYEPGKPKQRWGNVLITDETTADWLLTA